jgi:hypothetical protein
VKHRDSSGSDVVVLGKTVTSRKWKSVTKTVLVVEVSDGRSPRVLVILAKMPLMAMSRSCWVSQVRIRSATTLGSMDPEEALSVYVARGDVGGGWHGGGEHVWTPPLRTGCRDAIIHHLL